MLKSVSTLVLLATLALSGCAEGPSEIDFAALPPPRTAEERDARIAQIDKDIAYYQDIKQLLGAPTTLPGDSGTVAAVGALSDALTSGLEARDIANADREIARLQAAREKLAPSRSAAQGGGGSGAYKGGDVCDVGPKCIAAKDRALTLSNRLRRWATSGTRGVHNSAVADMCLMRASAEAMEVCANEAASIGNDQCQRASAQAAADYRAQASSAEATARQSSATGGMRSCASF